MGTEARFRDVRLPVLSVTSPEDTDAYGLVTTAAVRRAPYQYMPDRWIKVPDERVGLVFVFRVFDRVSYALVLNTSDPVVVGNYTRNP